jgi:hypothetical protein
MLRHVELACIRRTVLRHHACHLGNHIPGAAHDDRVSDTDVLRPHLIEIVQSRARHRDTADEYRLETRYGRQRAGATHLHFDRDDLARRLLRRKLMSNRESWRSRDVAESLL